MACSIRVPAALALQLPGNLDRFRIEVVGGAFGGVITKLSSMSSSILFSDQGDGPRALCRIRCCWPSSGSASATVATVCPRRKSCSADALRSTGIEAVFPDGVNFSGDVVGNHVVIDGGHGPGELTALLEVQHVSPTNPQDLLGQLFYLKYIRPLCTYPYCVDQCPEEKYGIGQRATLGGRFLRRDAVYGAPGLPHHLRAAARVGRPQNSRNLCS